MGNTTDFGSVILGSSPDTSTKHPSGAFIVSTIVDAPRREMRGVFTRKPFSTMNKDILSKILSVICIGAIILGCVVEGEDGGPCIWNYGCLAAAALSGIGIKLLEKKK